MILDDVRQAIIDAGIIPVTIGDLATDIDNCVCLFQQAGKRLNFFGGAKIDEQLIRIVVRNLEYGTGLTQIETIKDTLNIATGLNITLNNLESYQGRDDKRRNIWELAYLINH